MQMRQQFQRYSTVVTGLLIGLLVLIAYAPSLNIPLIYDAAWEARLAYNYTWLDVFMRTGDHGYYRPLLIAAYKIATIFGANAALFLHVLALICHAANAWLLLCITRLLIARPASTSSTQPTDTANANLFLPLTVAGLFTLNPLAVQAVALATGLNHEMALLFVLWALLRFLQIDGERLKHFVGLVLLAVLGFWSNEVALVLGGFCLICVGMQAWQTQKWDSNLGVAALLMLICGIYFGIYTLIPKGAAPAGTAELTSNTDELLRRLLYASQAITYPVAVLLRPMPNGDIFPIREAPAMLDTVAWAGVLVTMILAMLTWFTRRRYVMLTGVLLFLLAIAPPVLRLSVDYIHHAPRVFYVALPGAALVWAAFVAMLVDLHSANRNPDLKQPEPNTFMPSLPVWAVYSILVGLIGLIGFVHVREQIALHLRASTPVQAIAARAAALPTGSHILALDLPEWLSPSFRRFPLGAEIAQIGASYVKPSDFALANSGNAINVTSFSPSLSARPNQPYDYKVIGPEIEVSQLAAIAAKHEAVLWTHYLSESLHTDWLGGVEPSQNQRAAGFRLADGVEMRINITPCTQGWMLESRWRIIGPIQPPLRPTLSVFAQVINTDGATVAQVDGALIGGLLPLQLLPSDNKTVLDRRILTLPDHILAERNAATTHTLALGVYDYTTGIRLSLRGPDGERIQGDALYTALAPEINNRPCQ